MNYEVENKIRKEMYFINTGVKFDIHDKEKLFDVWNCNRNCCKADLANGLNCEDWGIYFNKDYAKDIIKNYVKDGVNQTYGYINKINVEMNAEDFEELINDLKEQYDYNDEQINKIGFIPFENSLIEELCPYWQEPDISYYKNDKGEIEKNTLHIYTEDKIDKEIMKYINEEIYMEGTN